MPECLKIHMEKPGLYTSIQDLGRIGFQDAGIPFSGAMDKESHKIANELVGNPHHYPTLEITQIGPEIRFEGTGQIALTGADMAAELNGKSIRRYETIDIKNNDHLILHQSRLGCRTYLAARGQWQTELWLNSHSAVSNLSSVEGIPKPLKALQCIEVSTPNFIPQRLYPEHLRPVFSSCYVLRVVTGPEFEQFGIEQIQSFFESVFTVSPDSNRMGYRLNGTLENYSTLREEISSGIVPGTVQITKSGQPIILTADAQTTGGYPRLANVIEEDLSIVGQMKAGDEVKFMLVGLPDL